jgi:hypothetical protein
LEANRHQPQKSDELFFGDLETFSNRPSEISEMSNAPSRERQSSDGVPAPPGSECFFGDGHGFETIKIRLRVKSILFFTFNPSLEFGLIHAIRLITSKLSGDDGNADA